MDNQNSVRRKAKQYWQLWFYLLPIVGAIPAVWTLARNNGSPQQQQVSRLAITLLLSWLTAYILLFFGADRSSELLAFRLLYANALLTTGYFLTCLWSISRLKAGKIPKSVFGKFGNTEQRSEITPPQER